MAEIDATLEELTRFCDEVVERLASVKTSDELTAAKEQIHAHTSPLAVISKAMRNVPPDDRPRIGSALHQARAQLEAAI